MTWLDGKYGWMTRQAWPRNGLAFWGAGRQTRPLHAIVLHSTETTGFPGYRGGADAPHFTIDMRSGATRQHVPLNYGSRALTLDGTREANVGGIVQIEMIGACTPDYPRRYGHYDIDAMPDPGPAHIARLLAAICRETGIPATTSVEWVPYPASYGRRARQRISVTEYLEYRGILGHQHVPGNDHGDPGDIPIAKVLNLTRALLGGQAPEPDTGWSGSVFFKGARGDKVKSWQGSLAAVGYGELLGSAGADGVFGEGTDKATKAFQRDVGITVDGRVGPDTLRQMEAVMDKLDKVLELLQGGKVFEARPDPSKGARHERFRYHDMWSLALYAADGGLAVQAILAAVQGELAGLREVVKQLAESHGSPVDLEAVQEATRKGVADALEAVTADVTVTVGAPANDEEEVQG